MNAKLELNGDNLIENLNDIQQEYSSHCNNFYVNNGIQQGYSPQGNNYYVYSDTNNPLSLPTEPQADNNRPNDGESKIVLLRSLEHLDCSQIEVSISDTNTLNTLICEVNEEYSF